MAAMLQLPSHISISTSAFAHSVSAAVRIWAAGRDDCSSSSFLLRWFISVALPVLEAVALCFATNVYASLHTVRGPALAQSASSPQQPQPVEQQQQQLANGGAVTSAPCPVSCVPPLLRPQDQDLCHFVGELGVVNVHPAVRRLLAPMSLAVTRVVRARSRRPRMPIVIPGAAHAPTAVSKPPRASPPSLPSLAHSAARPLRRPAHLLPQRRELLASKVHLSPIVAGVVMATVVSCGLVFGGRMTAVIELDLACLVSMLIVAVAGVATERFKPRGADDVLVRRLRAAAVRKAWLEKRMDVLTTASGQSEPEAALEAAAEKLHALTCVAGGAVVFVSFPPREQADAVGGGDRSSAGRSGGTATQDWGAGAAAASATWLPPRILVHVAADDEATRVTLNALMMRDISATSGGGAHRGGGRDAARRPQSTSTTATDQPPRASSPDAPLSRLGSGWRPPSQHSSASTGSRGSHHGGGSGGGGPFQEGSPAVPGNSTSLSFLRRVQGKRAVVSCGDFQQGCQRFADWSVAAGGGGGSSARRGRGRARLCLAASCLVSRGDGWEALFCMVVQGRDDGMSADRPTMDVDVRDFATDLSNVLADLDARQLQLRMEAARQGEEEAGRRQARTYWALLRRV